MTKKLVILVLVVLLAGIIGIASADEVSAPVIKSSCSHGTKITVAKVHDITEKSFSLDLIRISGRVAWVRYGLTPAMTFKSPDIKAHIGKAKVVITMKYTYEYGKTVYYQACDARGCGKEMKANLRRVNDPWKI